MATKNGKTEGAEPQTEQEKPQCFVIMPISDVEGYRPGHFRRVFDDIFTPACEMAGYSAVLASDVRETNLIHLDILQKLVRAEMVLCDLSTRNPNVLFELGLRQAFDKAVVLVKDEDTPRIFDTDIFRHVVYRKALDYREVLEDQKAIAENLSATAKASNEKKGANSIIRLLSIEPASFVDVSEAENNPIVQLVRADLIELGAEVRRIARVIDRQRPEVVYQIPIAPAPIASYERPVARRILRKKTPEAVQFAINALEGGRTAGEIFLALTDQGFINEVAMGVIRDAEAIVEHRAGEPPK